jgi:hypothetical protein
MGPYNAIVGVLVFFFVVGTIGAVDVLRGRGRQRTTGPKQLPLDLTPRESPRSQPPAHA